MRALSKAHVQGVFLSNLHRLLDNIVMPGDIGRHA
jgi:hypothetical protein